MNLVLCALYLVLCTWCFVLGALCFVLGALNLYSFELAFTGLLPSAPAYCSRPPGEIIIGPESS